MNAAGSSENAAIVTTEAQSVGVAADVPVDQPVDAPVESGPPVAAEPPTPGEILRRERERRSMSLLQVAEELHLGVRIVEAIEANHFEVLSAPVYARGHLRKYASLLGLSPQVIIQRYEALTVQPEAPTPVPVSSGIVTPADYERRGSLNAPVLISVVGLIVLAAAFWLFQHFTGSTTNDLAEQAMTLEPATAAPISAAGASETFAPAAITPGVAQAATQTVATQASTSSSEHVRVRLEYSEAAWTEIYDAAGKRLMFNLGEAGRARTISGTPPLRITLGNASAVKVQVNDRAVVVPRATGRDSARFVITAQGDLRAVQASDEVPVE